AHASIPAEADSLARVRSRAMSRLTRVSAAVLSSAPVACWKRRLKSSWRVSSSLRSSSSAVSSRISLAFKQITFPGHELGLHRQLHGGEADPPHRPPLPGHAER